MNLNLWSDNVADYMRCTFYVLYHSRGNASFTCIPSTRDEIKILSNGEIDPSIETWIVEKLTIALPLTATSTRHQRYSFIPRIENTRAIHRSQARLFREIFVRKIFLWRSLRFNFLATWSMRDTRTLRFNLYILNKKINLRQVHAVNDFFDACQAFEINRVYIGYYSRYYSDFKMVKAGDA